MDLGIIRRVNIDTEMQASYLDYAMSVIVARALPDVRDGLKPVHRRILYAMHDLGLTNDKVYKKSARIVGEVLGKYHPHGDAAVYEAMVRMAQDFSLRYPLVDGQGNFGSVDGDNAAAMRYTEARLASIANEMLTDIDKDTVEWTDNFDGTLREPVVLPAALPNLIVNGSSGIAVGMATNIPPHNLGEVCDALCYLIDNHERAEDVTVEDLMRFIQGPDFPTGGVVYRYQNEGSGAQAEQVDVIARAYGNGKGPIVVQAKAHIEEMSRNRNRIVITELPYMTDKTRLLERIAELARDGQLEGLTDLRDESDRTGMRINIELTRTVDPRDVLAKLFKLTPLQATFGVSLLALVDGEPRTLGLKRILQHFVEHREIVIKRRSEHELARARARAHILEGLLRALDVLDEIIALIRRSRNADAAKQNLMEQLKFDDLQAQAILDMQLRRLAALERRKLQDEYKETLALIKELEALLASPKKVLALIRQNLVDLKARYGDARRTQIADRVKGTLTTRDILPDEVVWVRLSTEGMLVRERRDAEARRGRAPEALLRDSAPQLLCAAHTRDDLFLFSVKGQATRVPVHRVPADGAGSHYADLSGLGRRDRIAAMLAFPKVLAEEDVTGFLLLGTVRGNVKRVALKDLFDQAQANPPVVKVEDGDELLWVARSQGGGEILLVTAFGQAIRFAEDDVRPMGLPAGGMGGIKLREHDCVVAGMAVHKSVNADGAAPAASPIAAGTARSCSLAIVTTGGFGKLVALAEFPVTGRNGLGVVAAKVADRSGELAGAASVEPDDLVACVLSGGAVKVVTAKDLPQMGRPALGKPVLELTKDQKVRDVFRIARAIPEAEAEVEPGVAGGAGAEGEDDHVGDDGAQADNGPVTLPAKPAGEAKSRTKTKTRPGTPTPPGARGKQPAGQEADPAANMPRAASTPPEATPKRVPKSAARMSAVSTSAPQAAAAPAPKVPALRPAAPKSASGKRPAEASGSAGKPAAAREAGAVAQPSLLPLDVPESSPTPARARTKEAPGTASGQAGSKPENGARGRTAPALPNAAGAGAEGVRPVASKRTWDRTEIETGPKAEPPQPAAKLPARRTTVTRSALGQAERRDPPAPSRSAADEAKPEPLQTVRRPGARRAPVARPSAGEDPGGDSDRPDQPGSASQARPASASGSMRSSRPARDVSGKPPDGGGGPAAPPIRAAGSKGKTGPAGH
jgi:DNA gyrase subunit A